MEPIYYYVYWDNIDRRTYLYGTDFVKQPGHYVTLRNPMMPPGTVMQQWSSAVEPFAAQKEPDLPLLIEGERYLFRVIARTSVPKTLLLRIRFYDRQGELIRNIVSDEAEKEITCPEGFARYTAELVNAGTQDLDFHCILIAPAELPEHLGELQAPTNDRGQLNILIPTREGHAVRVPSAGDLAGIPNCVVAPPEAMLATPYYTDGWLRKYRPEEWRAINFISIRRETDDIANDLAARYDRNGTTLLLNNLDQVRQAVHVLTDGNLRAVKDPDF